MQIYDQQKLYLKFASPVELIFEVEDLTGEYLFGADTDRDLQTACCVTAAATAADGKLIFNPAMDNTPFYERIQLSGKTAGFWEIRAVADNRCVASGMVIFSRGVVEPGYTPPPVPKIEYYDKPEVDALIATEIGVSEPLVRQMIADAVRIAPAASTAGGNHV